ncbi:MAG: hypothetical protein M3R36_09635 [Bacteroidota bacterium]|nr:hypothetical protein [Bacteroidota bacterium]
MTKKIYIGIVIGILTGLSIPVLLKLKRDEDLFSNEDLSDENDMLDNANHYLMLARNKVDEMVHEAEVESNSILDHAGKILSSAKEKTSTIHYELSESAEEKINKIKEEIDASIEEFRKKLGYEK